MITAETPRQFLAFARDNPAHDATVVLESDGGSVLGALELGRAIRRLGLLDHGRARGRAPAPRAAPSSASLIRGSTASRCAPSCCSAASSARCRLDARVLVHQIWLGDRREDAVAASYTRRGSGGRAARYRQHRAVHRGDGRRHRAGAAFAQGAAMGADARALPRRVAAHPSRSQRKTLAEKPPVTKTAAGPDLRTPTSGMPPASAAGCSATASGRPVLSRSASAHLEGERIGTFDLALPAPRRRQLHA